MTNTMNNKKAPYLSTWKQIMLCIFTIGIWNFTWTNRIMFFMNKYKGERKDTETKTLLNMFVPFFAVVWVSKLANDLEKDNAEKRTKLKRALVIVQSIACAVALFLFVTIVIAAKAMFKGEASGMFLVTLMRTIAVLLIPGMIQLIVLAKAQNRINEIAKENGISNSVAYSA